MITSLQNEKIKNYTKLHDKKYRHDEKLFIAIGHHLVEEALKKEMVKEILLLDKEENTYGEVTYVTGDILKKVSGLSSTPKVLAICYIKENNNIVGNIVIIDDIKDPGNLGTIIRSAVAFDYETIILSPETVDVYNSKVVRATEGAIFNINIIIQDLKTSINALKQDDYIIYGTSLTSGEQPVKETNKHALIIGSEASGTSDGVNKMCDKYLSIKMNEKTESLNASVAASILMYNLSR